MSRQEEELVSRSSLSHARIAALIWNIADDVLRNLYVRGMFRDVILPFTVLCSTRHIAKALDSLAPSVTTPLMVECEPFLGCASRVRASRSCLGSPA